MLHPVLEGVVLGASPRKLNGVFQGGDAGKATSTASGFFLFYLPIHLSSLSVIRIEISLRLAILYSILVSVEDGDGSNSLQLLTVLLF